MLNKYNFKVLTGDHTLSDHRYIIVNNLDRISSTETVLSTKINYKNIQKKLPDINRTSFEIYHSQLRSPFSQNKTFRKTLEITNNKKPWFKKYIKKLKRSRDKYYNLSKKYPLNLIFVESFKYFKKSLAK
jgi:hypothetical protein